MICCTAQVQRGQSNTDEPDPKAQAAKVVFDINVAAKAMKKVLVAKMRWGAARFNFCDEFLLLC